MTEDDTQWDYLYWLSPNGPSLLTSKEVVLENDGRLIHCLLVFSNQEEQTLLPDNPFFGTPSHPWHGSVLVMWVGHDWPRSLSVDSQLIERLLFS